MGRSNNAYAAAWRARNPEKVSKYQITYRARVKADPEWHLKRKAMYMARYNSRKAAKLCTGCGSGPPLPDVQYCLKCQAKARGYRPRYVTYGHGLTAGQALALRRDVGRCRVPECQERNVALLRVDHDHKTGKIRGVLCHKHNIGIGSLGDTFDGVYATAEYLAAAELPSLIDMLNARAE